MSVIRGVEMREDERSFDVVVIGSGPGGSLVAARFAESGLSVAVVEEGRWFEPRDFVLEEEAAYPALYQDNGGRATDDLAITILQGRSVGGGSTVNWMTSLRTPARTLEFWRERRKVSGLGAMELEPHFDAIERRLNVHTADDTDVNANNAVLRDGARALGIPTRLLPRNTRDCTNLGACSFGCPIGAKQTSQQTYLTDALRDGATLFTETRAVKLRLDGARVTAVECQAVGGGIFRLRARWVVVAGGAINSPRLLLKSGIVSPMTGRRTWLHPVVATVGEFDHDIDAWYGSPQSVSIDAHLDRGRAMGYFVETPPLHPMLASLATPWFGEEQASLMTRLRRVNALIGLTVDGFDGSEEGGTVRVTSTGRLRLRYPFTRRLQEASTEAMKLMARIQLAAGARQVLTLHSEPVMIRTESDVAKIDAARFGPGRLAMFTAHQMGGCGMSDDPRLGVTDSRGRHHEIGNLFVADGSLLPTGLGVNPMLTIYAVASHVANAFLTDEAGARPTGGAAANTAASLSR